MVFFSVLVLAAAVYLYSFHCLDAPISSALRAFLGTCRIVFLLLLLWLFTRPLIRETQTVPISPILYLALDDSLSMSFPVNPILKPGVNPEPSRWEMVKKSLIREGIRSFWEKQGITLRYGLFSAASTANPPTAMWSALFPASATPEFPYTDLSAVIRAFETARSPDESSYLLLFTDGQWNHGPNPRTTAGELVSATAANVSVIDQRIYSFGIGASEPIFDLALDSVNFPASVRTGEPIHLTIHAVARGDTVPASVPLQIRGGVKNGVQNIALDRMLSFTQTDREESFVMEIPAMPPGDYLFTVQIPPQPGELFTENNQFPCGIRIRDTRDRILILTGAPDWELKFLKRSLEDQAGYDPQAFLIQVQKVSCLGDRRWVLQQSPSAGASPALTETAETYSLDWIQTNLTKSGVVVLHNFNFKSSYEALANRLREYVENGGGILLIPGPLNSTPGAAFATPLPPPLVQVYLPNLTPVLPQPASLQASFLHTVFRDLQPTELPPLYPLFRVNSPSPGVSSLLEGMTQIGDRVGLITLFRYGLGRILVMGSNSFWRWQMLTGKGILPAFWAQVLSQCNPILQSQAGELITDAFLYETYAPVQLTYTARETAAEAVPGGISLQMKGPSHTESLWMGRDETHPGRYTARYTPIEAGDYTAAAELYDATVSFQVKTNLRETGDLRQNITDLRAIAQAAGGEYANSPAWKRLAESLPLASHTIQKDRTHFIGEKWWMVSGLIFLLGLEWFLRWKKGLP